MTFGKAKRSPCPMELVVALWRRATPIHLPVGGTSTASGARHSESEVDAELPCSRRIRLLPRNCALVAYDGDGKRVIKSSGTIYGYGIDGNVLYREAHILLEEITDATLDGSRREHIELLVTVPLLIIADLGMRKLPSSAAEELFVSFESKS